MSVKEDLIAMRELLTPEGSWCQGAAFKNDQGWSMLRHEGATSMCLMGASVVVANNTRGQRRRAIITALEKQIGCSRNSLDIADWNDQHTHKEVLALLDRCIADCTLQAKVSVTAPIMERELEPA